MQWELRGMKLRDFPALFFPHYDIFLPPTPRQGIIVLHHDILIVLSKHSFGLASHCYSTAYPTAWLATCDYTASPTPLQPFSNPAHKSHWRVKWMMAVFPLITSTNTSHYHPQSSPFTVINNATAPTITSCLLHIPPSKPASLNLENLDRSLNFNFFCLSSFNYYTSSAHTAPNCASNSTNHIKSLCIIVSNLHQLQH